MTKIIPDTSNILHIIYGSRTGNSRAAANLAYDYARYLGLRSVLVNMQEFDPLSIGDMKNLLIAVSTHGEGDPPLAAQNLLTHLSGAEAPTMKHSRFSVLALGDSSYRHFCKTGHDFEKSLLKLGATKIYPLQECDIDFEEGAIAWVKGSVEEFQKVLPEGKIDKKSLFSFVISRSDELEGNAYLAQVMDKKILNPSNPLRKVMHMSLSIKNSGISFQPGDSIGVYSYNARWLVDEVIRHHHFDPTHVLELKDMKMMLKQVLVTGYELTLLTPVVMKKYAELTGNEALGKLLQDQKKTEQYSLTRDVLDMVQEFPTRITVEEFLSVLRKLPPRLYSVASSLKKHPDEVQLMVGLVSFSQNKRSYEGVASSYLAVRTEKGESVGIYVEENQKFHLPEADKPVIMIGAGTGLAPFRAFLQERDATNAPGKNWLFFGEQFEASDFHYRDELEGYVKQGLLTRLDTAFSREGRQKTYVTHRMMENSREIFQWIREGAIVYVSGNKRKLAVSVRGALRSIIRREGGYTPAEATEFLKKMKLDNRFREDVY